MSLRVISGIKKGFKILSPDSKDSRPTEDRIKENIFNIISPIEEDAVVLDLFACTGNIGIEFLSRGARKVYFSELNNSNLEKLKNNIKHVNFEEKSVILSGDFRTNLQRILDKVDYVYLDPPYKSGYYEIALELILKNNLFNDSLIITEMDEDIDLSTKFFEIEKVYQKKYGKKYISFYREKE